MPVAQKRLAPVGCSLSIQPVAAAPGLGTKPDPVAAVTGTGSRRVENSSYKTPAAECSSATAGSARYSCIR